MTKEKILIFGSNGALGKSVIKKICKKYILIKSSRLKFKNQKIDISFKKEYGSGIKAIINCAGIIGLEKCIDNKDDAYQINGFIPCKLLEKSRNEGIPLLHFSTESVFKCNIKNYLYSENDKPEPTTIYGKSKLIGEGISFDYEKKHTICRLPMLYGEQNEHQIISKLITKLIKGEIVSVSNDVYSTPMNSDDVADFVYRWITECKDYIGQVIHLSSDKYLSLFDTIKMAKEKLNLKGELNEVNSSFLTSSEKKPLFGGLKSNKVDLFNFNSSFEKYLKSYRVR